MAWPPAQAKPEERKTRIAPEAKLHLEAPPRCA
jgi:hypothetical protein